MDEYELRQELTKKAQKYLIGIGRAEAKPDEGWDDVGVWITEKPLADYMNRLYMFPRHTGLAYVALVRDHRHGPLYLRAKEEENDDWTFDTMPERE